MFDKFTDDCKKAMNLGRLEAMRFKHGYLGPEHMALGLLVGAENGATRMLKALGVQPASLFADISAQLVATPDGTGPGQIPFTAPAKKVLEVTMVEAAAAGRATIDTGYMLLALAVVPGTIPFEMLANRGVDAAAIRAKLVLGAGWDVQAGDEVGTDPRISVLRNAGELLRALGRQRLALEVEVVAEELDRPAQG